MKHLLTLVIVAEGHVYAQLDPALSGLQLSHDHSKERGLAHAVRPYDADPLSPLDIHVQVGEKMPVGLSVIKSLPQVLSLKHVASRLEVLLEGELHVLS